MISLHSTIIVISWLATLSSSFSPGLPSVSVASSPASQHHDFLNVNGASYSCKCNKSKRKRSGSPTPIAPLHLSQSANDNINGFHYDQEPRGTSFISQVSQQDLWERRQMRRPQQQRLRQALQQRAPNSRGAVTGQNHQQYLQQPMPMPMQQYYPTNTNTIGVGATEEELGVVGDGEDFDIFKDNVSTNLKSMTTLLKEMQQSQSVQSSDVQSLTFKVADMTDRLYRAEQMKNRINKGGGGTAASSSSSSSSQMDVTSDRNFGTSLDGEFNKNVKNHIVDEFEMVDNSRDNYHQQQQQQQQPLESGGTGGEYYKEKIAQLEARINMIDDDLQTTEDRFNTQMEYVDMLVNQRLDDVDGQQQQASFEFERMPFQNQPPPGIMMGEPPFRMEDGPLPPPPPPPRPPTMEEMEAQMQQQQQQSSQEMDDGRQHFQERNYNVPNIPPPHEQVIPSSQNQQQQQQQQRQSDQSRSVNTRSGGHHYNEKNTSFMSAFSKADNEQRKQFQPFTRDPRRNEVRVGEQLPRGVVNAPNRRGGEFVAPPPPGGPMMNPDMMSPDFGGEIDRPYHMMEGGGPMMMEDDRMMFEDEMMMQGEYFDNDMMYGF